MIGGLIFLQEVEELHKICEKSPQRHSVRTANHTSNNKSYNP